jgi:hypothetical protein
MGQLVAVTEKPSSSRGIVRFELNRALTGMGHERFASVADTYGDRPAAVLANRLFATGQVGAVHVYANIVTVDLAKGATGTGLADIIRNLHTYWYPGMHPPSFEDLVPDEPAAEGGASGEGDDGGDPGLAAAAKRVPMHLLERGRAAREKYRAKAG